MARQARQQSSTQYYHVMIRGINKENIFKNVENKEYYMTLLKEQQDEERVIIAGWCLMNNHVHLVLKADITDMSKAIKIVSIKYASYYNKKYNRIGPLFGDRYKSKNIEDDNYLLAVMRYVHNNPVEADFVNQVEDYFWSSYPEYLNEIKYIDRTQKEFVLGYFNNKLDSFIDFHREEDNKIYLDTKEDIEKRQVEKSFKLRQWYIKEYSIENSNQLRDNKVLLGELSSKLINEYGFSLRKIAKLLELHYSVVHRAVIEYKDSNN